MAAIRTLVVDDSVVVRKLVSDQLSAAAGIEVIGSAPNGKIALQKMERERPDLVVLDVEMPVMDGLETLREIKRRDASILVIMFSSFTVAGAQVTVDALTLGAEDYVPKPADLLDAEAATRAIQEGLVAKIRLLAGRGAKPLHRSKAPAASPLSAPLSRPGGIDAIAIGASTGGPNALAELFSRFPASIPVPILIVQHMPAIFTPHFADRLARESVLPVHEAADGMPARAGQAYLAPGGKHLRVSAVGGETILRTDQSPPVHSCRPAADVLFKSVCEVFGSRSLAVVLTGMGEDGLAGARELRAAGARVLVQDEESSVVWGMAGAVSRAGLADAALPILELADEVVRRARIGRLR